MNKQTTKINLHIIRKIKQLKYKKVVGDGSVHWGGLDSTETLF